MICYHNLGEIAHDVVTACLVRIGIKKRARCCDYWEVGITKTSHSSRHFPFFSICLSKIAPCSRPIPPHSKRCKYIVFRRNRIVIQEIGITKVIDYLYINRIYSICFLKGVYRIRYSSALEV